MTQAKVIQAPAAPGAPAGPGVYGVTPQAIAGPPVTARDVAALKARRKELSDQLINVSNRRDEVAKQLQTAKGADKAGLEQRMAVLDTRIARLESDIDQSGQLLASPAYTAVIQQNQSSSAQDKLAEMWGPILIVFTIFVLCPVAIAWARSIWRRGSAPRSAATADRDTAIRLERMEQAVDAIAIEIERVSEGQRFVTRLLAEGKAAVPIPMVAAEQGEKVSR
jgi:hypothetical protein